MGQAIVFKAQHHKTEVPAESRVEKQFMSQINSARPAEGTTIRVIAGCLPTVFRFVIVEAKDSIKSGFWLRKSAAVSLMTALLIQILLPIPILASYRQTPEQKFTDQMLAAPVAAGTEVGLAGTGLAWLEANTVKIGDKLEFPTVKTGAEGNDPSGDPETDSARAAVESLAKRTALAKRVKRIETHFETLQTLIVGQRVPLAALPLDERGNAVHGIVPSWQTSDHNVLEIGNNQAIALTAGEATLTVKAGAVTESVTVKVLEAAEPEKSNSGKASKTEAKSNRVNPATVKPAAAPAPMLLSPLPDTEHDSVYSPQNNLGNPPGQVQMDSPNVAAALPIKHRAGIANFSFGVGFASLPGRGVDASVGMTYNSRTWNKSCTAYDTGGNCTNNHFTYDVEESWVTPGFNVGFGYVESYRTGSSSPYTVVPYGLTEADGTRHELQCKSYTGSLCDYYQTSDGSFIKVTRNYFPNARTSGFTAVYPDGTKINYAYPTDPDYAGKYFPYSIQDSNGNRISIVYKDQSGRIDYIRDTLNRYIRFLYEPTGNQRLIAVTVPGYNGSSQDRQTIRFYYQENVMLNSTGKFSGTITAPAAIRTLQYVYFPATNTGYKYDYNTNFGMISKISQLHGMTVSTTAADQTGTVTSEGTAAATTEYNYPDGSTPLTDAPKYTQRTDDWAGRTAPAAAITLYNSPDPVYGVDTTSSVTVKDADFNFDVEYKTIFYDTADYLNGLVKETDVTKLYGPTRQYRTLMSKNTFVWAQGSGAFGGRQNPVLQSVETTDDAGQLTKVEYTYDSYNNRTAVKEYGFKSGGSYPTNPLRQTNTAYQTGAGWINANLLRLPVSQTITAGGQTVAKTLIYYDNSTGANNTASDSNMDSRTDVDIVTHDIYYNPAYPAGCRYVCPDPENDHNCNGYTTNSDANHCVRVTTYGYSPNSAYRGNVTKVVQLADATKTDETSDPQASVTATRYDILGNPVEASVNCCRKKTWSYGTTFSETGYAYQVGQARGQSGQLTSSATYDVNTGLIKTGTDENGQVTTNTYDPASLRVTRTDYPNGGYTINEYSDAAISSIKTRTRIDSLKESESWQFANGRGAIFRSRTRTPEGTYLSSDVEYDTLGRVQRTFNPYTAATADISSVRPASVVATQVTNRDALGRALTVQLQDNTTASTLYSGSLTTVTDQAGKQRRQTTDGLGRVIRVDEPDASGNLDAGGSPAQPTVYEYDWLDNLTKVTQAAGGVTQDRVFVYDALSRLVKERQPEMSPTLDDTGVKGAVSSTKWTGVYHYNSFGLLDWGVDARGVKSTMSYDTLNRPKTVAYTNEPGTATPGVTYTYGDEATTPLPFSKDRVTKIETTPANGSIFPATANNYSYNSTGQVTQQTQQIGSQNYALSYNYNLAGQMVSETYPTGKVLRTAVDSMGRTARVYDARQTYVSGFQYAGTGQLSAMFVGNGTQETYSYDPNRLQMTGQTLLKGTNVLERYNYGYGKVDLATGTVDATKNNGQLAKVESFAGGTQSSPTKQFEQRFDYDSLGRLAESREYRGDAPSTQSYKQHFDYDRWGNQYHKAASNATAGQQTPLPYTPIEDADINKSKNRLLETGTTSTVYDEAGNVTSDNKFRNFDYAYDANNRMVKAHYNKTTPTPPDAISTYDAAGKRVATQNGTAWRLMVYDISGQMICEYTSGTATAGIGTVQYLFADRQGSTRTITDSSGTVQGRLDYTAFGEDIGAGTGQRTSAQGYGNGSPTRQKYGMTEQDEATGLEHTDWRKNENRAGRFTSPDPYKGSMNTGDPQSFNRYTYTQNDPTNFVDPSGLNLIAFCWSYDTYTNDEHGATTTNHSGCYYMETGGSSNTGLSLPEQINGQAANPLRDAIDLARNVLLNNKSCRDLFAKGVDPVGLLNQLEKGGNITPANLGGAASNGSVRNAETNGVLGTRLVSRVGDNGVTLTRQSAWVGANITVNNNSAAPFQNGYAGRYGASDAVNRAITIIHELGHAANFIYGNSYSGDAASAINQNDGDNTPTANANSRDNSQRVFDNCFSGAAQ